MSHALLRFTGAAAATLAVLCAAGAWPTSRLAGAAGLASMALAAGISLAGALVGYVPLALASSAEEPQANLVGRMQAALIGISIRLFVTLGAVLVVLQAGAAPARAPFVVWVGIDYAALLALETAWVLRATGRADGKGPASA